ncbi:YgaP-like transmembrane domain [Pseudonocardia sp.]|uniref:YgaP-like transmembrane domain n=1 Tax=Pseudonocardia sp. TaxID=60912 RepID=UPI0026329860|nr:YgaP-like transmembrane domain [Pseudonocardia sp.]
MGFVGFMSSAAGRLTRILAGIVLIVVGLAVVGGIGGVVLAVVGLVPLAAGVFNFCLLGPLFGVGLRGGSRTGG